MIGVPEQAAGGEDLRPGVVEDGVGALFTNGRLEEVVTRRPEAHLYWVQADETNGVTEEALSCRWLNGASRYGS